MNAGGIRLSDAVQNRWCMIAPKLGWACNDEWGDTTLRRGHLPMLRNIMIASAVMLATAALAPTGAWAGGGHGHGHHRHHGHHVRPFHGHFHGHHHFRCWRWVMTRFGYQKIWVCG